MTVQDAQEQATGGHAAASRAAALLTLCEFPGTHIVELSRILGLTHSAAVRVVDVLASEGLIARSSGVGDARRIALVPTAEGKRRGREMRAAREQALEGLLAPLSEGQRDQLAQILDAMLGGVPRRRDEARHICRFCEHSACTGSSCPVGRSVDKE